MTIYCEVVPEYIGTISVYGSSCHSHFFLKNQSLCFSFLDNPIVERVAKKYGYRYRERTGGKNKKPEASLICPDFAIFVYASHLLFFCPIFYIFLKFHS